MTRSEPPRQLLGDPALLAKVVDIAVSGML